jgi:hypothetical protein
MTSLLKQPIKPRTARICAAVVALTVVSGCSNGTPVAVSETTTASTSIVASQQAEPPETRAPGKRVKALDFAIDSGSDTSLSPSATVSDSAGSDTVPAATPSMAVAALVRSAISRDAAGAWLHISEADQGRIGYSQRLTEEFNAVGWTSFTIEDEVADLVTVAVTQTPKISEITGVTASTAIVRVKTIAEAGGFKVMWSRRIVEQQFPTVSPDQDSMVTESVRAWAVGKQQCESKTPNEYSSGLVGVVGLADALCNAVGVPTVVAVGDLDALDEPEPILQAFGGSALLWARVATVSAPVRMSVVVAPLGKDWIVVGVARPPISEP